MVETFLRSLVLRRDAVDDPDAYPFSIPAVRTLGELALDAPVTFLAGEKSHGESFLSVIVNRFGPNGLSVLDEPEAALSLRGCLALMRRMHELVAAGSQFVVSTHSPVLLGSPGALIYVLAEAGIEETPYEETEQYELTRSFLDDRERFLHYLFADEP